MQKVIKYMFSKRSLPVLVLVLAAGIFVAFRTLGTTPPPTKYEQILHNVGELLEQVHYSPKKLDDEFSKEVFSKYLEALDPEKNIFLQSDIEQLKKYENKIDDEILGGPVQFVPAAYDVFKKRLDELSKLSKEIADKPMDFHTNETVVMDADKLSFPKNEQERKDRWRKYVTYMLLDRYVDLLETQEKSKGKPGYVVKSNSDMEKEAREKVTRILTRRYENSKVTINNDIAFNLFVNTITQKMDPHTDYFPPIDKMAFDYQISGHFFGIGASLRDEDGVIKIGSLLTGSPAWKSGEIQVGDAIQKVAQGNAEPVDLSGYFVEDAVKIIRGAKGTVVKLTIKKPDGTTKVVTLVRDEIKDEEKFARSAIVSNGKSKIGFIYLPDFYADFDDPKGARCSADVAKELVKLKEQKVDGVVMDLRGNGGGAID
jgi:carboxyl-terminal processing protease